MAARDKRKFLLDIRKQKKQQNVETGGQKTKRNNAELL
jgi:hypothetical protein